MPGGYLLYWECDFIENRFMFLVDAKIFHDQYRLKYLTPKEVDTTYC